MKGSGINQPTGLMKVLETAGPSRPAVTFLILRSEPQEKTNTNSSVIANASLLNPDTSRPANSNPIQGAELTNKLPIYSIRMGLIKASIWRNETKAGTRHNVTIVRLFRNGDIWQESTRFGRDDLPLVSKVIDLAHEWIYFHADEQQGASS